MSDTIKTECYYVPFGRIRLYFPQYDFHTHKDGKLELSWDATTLRLTKSITNLSLPYYPFSNLNRMVVPSYDPSNYKYLIVAVDFA